MAFAVLAVILFFLPMSYREAIARGVRATVLRPVLALQQGVVERDIRYANPERLRAERDSLAAFLVGQATLSAENDQLRELLGLRARLPHGFVPAEVVRVPGRAVEGFFQLTAGARQGIHAGAPIVAAQGLVGRVRTVDDDVSFGLDWTNPEFRASAMTLDGTIYGIVEPRRSPGGEPMLALTGTPTHIQLSERTMIVTSGHGGVFPRGIPIGSVAGVETGETSWQKSYLIRPLVGPANMTYVLVLTAPQDSLAGDDLAARWGIRATPAPAVDPAALAAAVAAPQPRPAPDEPRRSENGGPRLLGVPVTEQPAAAPDTVAGQGNG